MPFDSILIWTAAGSAACWIFLACFNGRFWRADQRLRGTPPDSGALPRWPAVVTVVPARDEAESIERALRSLLAQDYPGDLRIVAVDDHSSDGTGALARRLAREHPQGARVSVVETEEPPRGWVGKMWAVHTGIRAAEAQRPMATYLHLTDADVEHSPHNLREMVYKAETERLDLVSLMVALRCETHWEKLLIPAFVYFFQLLYPFPRINDPRSRVAGAAGGNMLLRADALERAGGIAAIRDRVIDDCALGAAIKSIGRIWVGLSESERCLRRYAGLGEIWQMVARSAYTELRHSPRRLAAACAGIALAFLAPPLGVLGYPFHASAPAAALAAGAWLAMAWTFGPTARLYRRPPASGALLPLASLLYLAMTLDSALQHRMGTGARWKGRVGAVGACDALPAVARNAPSGTARC